MQDARNTTRNAVANALRSLTGSGRRIGWLAAITLLLGVAETMAADAAAVVRLHSSAVVTSDQITLQDIASLEGQAAQLAAVWPISNAPLPGQSGIITHQQLERVLAHHGANMSQWIIRGATRCTVQRPAELRNNGVQPAAGVTVADDFASIPVPRTLEEHLVAHIGGRITELDGRPIVRFARGSEKYLSLSEPTYSFRITNADDRLLGHVGFSVAVYENNEVQQTIPMLAEVAVARQVVVAARNINRGQMVVGDDVRMSEQVFDSLDDLGLTDVNMVIGQRARCLVREQTQISSRDIELLPLVERNEVVKVRVRHQGFIVETTARAMESGGLGDIVRLRNERSGDSFTGSVIGRRTVEATMSMRVAKLTGVSR